jgi:hypothetical protein
MNTQEIWKVIAECNGEYYVSSWGRVKSFKFGKERILKPILVGRGYPAIDFWYLSKRIKRQTIHRLVALAFIPNPLNKEQVNHKDGNKLNNHIGNLEWATASENNKHAWQNGLCESKRLAISKPVIDIVTGKEYKSLINACKDIGEPYTSHKKRHQKSSKNQRFFYITDGNR